MTILQKIKTIWKNRTLITEGIKNWVFTKKEIREVAKERLSICRSNQCGYYDKKGKTEKVILKGCEACGACGCSLLLKTFSMESVCGLEEVGREPLWKENEYNK